MKFPTLGAALAALLLIGLAVPASADVMSARLKLAAIFEAKECFMTDTELVSEANAAGISRGDRTGALRMMRSEGVIGTGRIEGYAVIMYRGDGPCVGASFRNPPSRLETAPSDGTEQAAVEAIIAFMEDNGCIATDDEIREAVAIAGATDRARIRALRALKGQLVTIRDGSFPGLRLTGTAQCP